MYKIIETFSIRAFKYIQWERLLFFIEPFDELYYLPLSTELIIHKKYLKIQKAISNLISLNYKYLKQ